MQAKYYSTVRVGNRKNAYVLNKRKKEEIYARSRLMLVRNGLRENDILREPRL